MISVSVAKLLQDYVLVAKNKEFPGILKDC